MMLHELTVGSKVTIHDRNWRTYKSEPSAVVTIVAVSERVLKTDDGNRWHPHRGTPLDERGKESKGSKRIYPHREGDDDFVVKANLANKCAGFLSPSSNDEGPMGNIDLISKEDWAMLHRIAAKFNTTLLENSKKE